MKNNSLSSMERLWRLLNPDRKEIRNIYIYAIFAGLVNLSLPIGIQSIINLIQGGQMSTSLIVLIFFVILGVAFAGILQVNQLVISEYLQQKIFARAAFEFSYRLPKIRLEALYKYFAPELMNRFFDIVSIQKGLTKILIDFSTASIQTVFGLILLSLYHPFFIIFSLILVILVITIFRMTTAPGLATSLVESKNKYQIAHWLEELARTSVSFKLAGKTDLPLHKTNSLVDKYIGARESHFQVLMNQYVLMILFKVLIAAGLLIAGSILVIQQQMNIGQFVAAEIIILLVLNSVEKLILSLETIYDVLTSLEKVGQVTDLDLELDQGSQKLDIECNGGMKVEFTKVSFHYPGQERKILDKANMTINSGESAIVIGGNDSGKTTLLYLMAGLYRLQEGSVSYDEIPYGNYNPNQLRSHIGEFLNDESLFEGTIMENITMGRQRATFENVKWAIEMVGLTDFIKSLPQGYETMVLAQGKQFSKGIITKLILARSIADKPKLLLIEDRLSSLEPGERDQIYNFLVRKDQPWTLVVSTKEIRLAEKVDRVFELNNGLITELEK